MKRIDNPQGADDRMAIELQDGSIHVGYSFGFDKSVAGELVFQTGMVGYPESITDPSYRGQILVITWPLVGNYGVPSREACDELLKEIPAHFESAEIHIAGLVVAHYAGEEFSHHLAKCSLGTWLKEQKVPALYGVDTRLLTKKIREQGSMLGRMLLQTSNVNGHIEGVEFDSTITSGKSLKPYFEDIGWTNPNERNLVAEVSCREPQLYSPKNGLKHPSGRPVRVLCVDVGLKYNQLRCLVSRGVEVLRVPWDYDFPKLAGKEYDGLFISNGPGDPATLGSTVSRIRTAVSEGRTPIFGICLGHQLLARAAGAKTLKMKFGNRGHNIPCTNKKSGRCYITSQNHGYAVDAQSLPSDWEEVFVNANDWSNEGIAHKLKPIFSVQFHPESTPGPRDTEFLFDVFLTAVKDSIASTDALLRPVTFPGGLLEDNERVYPLQTPKKVLVLGSGGLSIGQAGEFDYSGSQAIKALKEEGIYTILINPNIATIQTSKGLADKVYFLPVNADSVRKVIKHERPDAIYVTFGGQTALQVGIQLKDEFEALGVKVLGTPIETIITTEDRELFARSMEQIGEKCAKSASANTVDEAVAAARDIGYPVIVRAAYALGGLGSFFADNEAQMLERCGIAFSASPQVLVERSMKGWKEIEYEVVRDCRDNCITVCNMENFDPLGIHTGDSIVVAPSQTLSDEDYNMLRTTAVNVIRHLGVIGECNIQYALNPFSKEYCIIEVNARLSRSSALASKATGYPLAFVAAKLGLGIPLNSVKNSVTQVTCACFEPSLDYVVVKIPRWDLKKFTRVSTALGSSMKSVGEVMSIGRTFEEAIQKAIRAVEGKNLGFNETDALLKIDAELQTPSDQRMFAIANAMHAGYSVDKIWELTRIDKWFLHRLKGLSDFGKYLSSNRDTRTSSSILRQAKRLGFSDRQLAKFWSTNEGAVRERRLQAGIMPVVKQIDTVAAEFPAYTNYLYLTYNGSEHDIDFTDRGVMVLGSGVYRIGSSVEFDWCSVRTIRTLRESGYKTVMVNYNPETVSTDYDEADKLYFENITLEVVLDIYQLESSRGIILSMGGQTPNNIASDLGNANVNIYGTSPDNIDQAENRHRFSRMIQEISVDQPRWKLMTTMEEATAGCQELGYPVLVRPSYVLSGAAMNTVYSEPDLGNYLQQARSVSEDHPVVITKYIENAKEIEMDAVARNGKLIGHFISEHVENAGVHSGDATLILPPQDLDAVTVRKIEDATRKIADALNVTGPFNIQFIAKDNEIKVIECNVRASRSFPFVSKVTGVDLIEMATKAMLGLPVEEYPTPQIPKNYVGVKVPQFSFSRLAGADPVLGVEMASTGEVACFGRDKYEAYIKGLISTGFKLPKKNILLSIGGWKDKTEMLPSIRALHQLGYHLFATAGTYDYLESNNIPAKYLETLTNEAENQASQYSLMQHLANNLIDLYINLPSSNKYRRPANYTSAGYRTRRMAVDYQVPLVTNVKNAKILIEALARNYKLEITDIDYKTSHETAHLPGLINISAFVPGVVNPENYDLEFVSKASVAAGFSMIRVLPLDNSIHDGRTVKIAQANSRSRAYCDYNFSIAATANNAQQIGQLTTHVGSLFIRSNYLSGNVNKVAAINELFTNWPEFKPIITDARDSDLSLLLLASLQTRKLHVTSITTADDINMILLSRSKGVKVTVDVSVYALFFSQEDYPHCKFLPTKQDQEALWQNLSSIDVFSIGSLPYQLAVAAKEEATPTVGIADALPLLFSAVREGRLTIDDIKEKFYTNPKTIFDIHDQDDSSIEVEIDRPYVRQMSSIWSPLVGRTLFGSVKQVVFKGKTSCIDGELTADAKFGSDMSSHMPTITSPELQPVFSPIVQSRPGTTIDRRSSILATRPTRAELEIAAQAPIFEDSLDPPTDQVVKYPHIRSLIKDSRFKGKDILSVDQFKREDLHLIFTIAGEMRLRVQREGVLDILKGKLLCTLFYEPSTRTSASFDAAMKRLGGQVSAIQVSQSSTVKGESIGDTIRTLACYGNAIVMRHPEVDSIYIASKAGKAAKTPIINAGNGSAEHPTQSLLDLYTIREELGSINGLTITFIGDLKYGRTVHSLIKLLKEYSVKIQLVSPKALSLPLDVRHSIGPKRIIAESEVLTEDIVRHSNVLYCTRVQKERFEDLAEYERLKDRLVVNSSTLAHASPHAIVMHPLPRNNEIDEEVDYDSRAVYFKQMEYGLYVRMALLALVLAP